MKCDNLVDISKAIVYKKHSIIIERDEDANNWWYIQVISPKGTYLYDGWWQNSEDKTAKEALQEAKKGAMLK